MSSRRTFATILTTTLVALLAANTIVSTKDSRADTITLKNQAVLRGSVDKDNTLIQISDPVKRTVIRDSKVAKVESDNSRANQVTFTLVQPLEKPAGALPQYALGVQFTPWDEKARRSFSFYGNRSNKPTRMLQCINLLGPYWSNYRGIDGFWVGKLYTTQIPKPVILGILKRVDQTNEDERLRIARFLIQAEWYAEAKEELAQIAKDFPARKDSALASRKAVVLAEARQFLTESDRLQRAQQPQAKVNILRNFPFRDKELPSELIDEARGLLRKSEDQSAANRRLADTLQELFEKLSPAEQDAWKTPLFETKKAILEVFDVISNRFEAFQKAEPSTTLEARFALAMSGYVVGSEAAVQDLRIAATFWKARDLARNYLGNPDAAQRAAKLVELQDLDKIDLDILTRLVERMPPPNSDEFAKGFTPPRPKPVVKPSVKDATQEKRKDAKKDGASEVPKAAEPMPEPKAEKEKADDEKPSRTEGSDLTKAATLQPGESAKATAPIAETTSPKTGIPLFQRVPNDQNEVPTDYFVILPPEYHPLREYPTIVALHDGRGPQLAAKFWADEAAKNGYIVIAPEFNTPNATPDYRYTVSEHAAVELAIRDARKRYAIDSDRVFLGGVGIGGNMAWDFGLAHPDLFAGVVAMSGIPVKYVPKYRKNSELVPFYVVNGELTPGVRDIIFDGMIRPMISDVVNITYVEYFRRGVEGFPEELPAALDWMNRRKREAVAKQFRVSSARESDNHFYGVVINEFNAGRDMAPEAVDPLGGNLKPATINYRSSNLSNLINITVAGINKLDVWVSPKLIDFKRRMEVRINAKTFYKGMPPTEYTAMLEDLRLRADRKQIYWMKVSTDRK